MARAIDGELLELEIANIANKLAKSDAQKALMGRVAWSCTANTGRPLTGRRKGGKIMKIPAEFEDILRGVELTEREKRFLRWITSWDDHTMQNMRTVVEKVRSTLSTLQAENKELRAELEQVKRERDAAVSDLTFVVNQLL